MWTAKLFWFFKLWWIYLLIAFWTFITHGKQMWLSLTREREKIFQKIFLFLLGIILAHFLLKFSLYWFKPEYSLPSVLINKQVKLLTSNKKVWKIMLGVLVSCVVAPLVEECVFRYFIFEILGKNNPFSYFASYLTFTFSHWQWGKESFLFPFFQYSVATIGFIWIYRQSNWNLIYPIILHSIVNVVLIAIILINPNFPFI